MIPFASPVLSRQLAPVLMARGSVAQQTTVTWLSSRPPRSASSPPRMPSPLTRPLPKLPSPSCRPLTRSVSASLSTSPSFTTRSSTRRTARASWPSRPLTTPLPSSTPCPKSHTRTLPSSCSFSGTTLHSGRQTCRMRRRATMATCRWKTRARSKRIISLKSSHPHMGQW